MAVAVFVEEVAGRQWSEVVERRSESVGLSACALAWEKPAGLASGGGEREEREGEREREEREGEERERGRRERGGGERGRRKREGAERGRRREREGQNRWEGWKGEGRGWGKKLHEHVISLKLLVKLHIQYMNIPALRACPVWQMAWQ